MKIAMLHEWGEKKTLLKHKNENMKKKRQKCKYQFYLEATIETYE